MHRHSILILAALALYACDPRGSGQRRGPTQSIDLGGPPADAGDAAPPSAPSDGGPPAVDAAPVDPATRLTIAAYNVYNLFDLVDDPRTDEGEFTPGPGWNAADLQRRVAELARVFEVIGADMISVTEVESEAALTALRDGIRELGGPDYPWLAVSPSGDGRGIRLGFMSRYPIVQAASRPINRVHMCTGAEGAQTLDGRRPESRPIFQVTVNLDADPEADAIFLVNHWKAKTSSAFPCEDEQHRLRSALQLRDAIDGLLAEDPSRPVIALGDFNAFEFEEPLRFTLDAALDADEVSADGDLYNIWGDAGVEFFNSNSNSRNNATNSSYNFRGDWTRLDHILLTGNLRPDGGSAEWKWVPDTGGNVFEGFMLDARGRPFVWDDRSGRGFSDHLPVRIDLEVR